MNLVRSTEELLRKRPPLSVVRVQTKATPVRAMMYRNEDVIKRFQKKLNLSQKEAELLFQDMLKFLCLSEGRIELIPSTRIDDAWHHFILFTRDYATFCQTHFGKFIHHNPARGTPRPRTLRRGIAKTIELAVKEYGPLSENWKYDIDLSVCSRCDPCNT